MSGEWLAAAVQMDVRLGDPQANRARLGEAIREAASRGAKLIVFPECAVTGYCFASREEAIELAEPVPGPSCEAVAAACRQAGALAVFGLLERDADRLFNACVLVGPQGVLGAYRKIHLPYLGVDRFATPGDRPFAVHDAGLARIGLNICYDGAFPESARILALLGADLIALPTNWPPGAECFAEHAINTRSMENRVYYIAADRVGRERGFRFIGRSIICGVDGQTLAQAGPDDETILYAAIEPAKARAKRVERVPGEHVIDRIADRRPEMYGPLTAPRG